MGTRALVPLVLCLMIAGAFQPLATAQPRPTPAFVWRDGYHTYDSMTAELQGLQATYPDLVMLESIGKTYEGRDIWAAKLSDDVTTNDSSEPDVLIFGGIHAREIMGPEIPMFVLNYMLDNYGKNETISNYINTRETWFVPMLNPDGHAYVEQGNDWRGNRRPTTGGNIGVDLNRNWGYMFGVDGATSDDPASQVYHGPYPFSENETIALRDLALRQHFVTELSFHSVASLVLFPWGFTDVHAPDYDELDAMAVQIASWNGYTPEQSSQLYFTHGDSEDWFYANISAKAFTIELDTAFGPPPSQIPISCALNREPVLYLIGYPNASITDAGVFRVAAPSNNTLVDPDLGLNLSVDVMNYGSGVENIPVELNITSGCYTFTNSTSLSLRAGQNYAWNFSWQPPLSAIENCTLSVRTNLTGDSSSWNDEKGSVFRVKSKYGVALDAAEVNQTCFPGQNISYPLVLRSLSNRDDDIIIDPEGGKVAWASIPRAVHLPAAGEADLELNISVPRDATPGDVASISVRAYSSTGQGPGGAVSTRTTVLDPHPTAEAGGDITVNVTMEVVFNGSLSSTPTGRLVNFAWDFGDGTAGEGMTVRHAYMKHGYYEVNLTVANDLGWQGTDSVNVAVLQDFRLNLTADVSELGLLPGGTANVNLTVRNDGNGPDLADITLDALKWNASIGEHNFSLAPGGGGRFTLLVTAPRDALAGAQALFRVSAVSRETPYDRAELIVKATVGELHDITFVITDTSRVLDAGQKADFTAVFNNSGNVVERANLTAADVPQGWSVELSSPNVTLEPWSNATVRISVAVPASALAGDYTFSVNGAGLSVTVRASFGLEASLDNASSTLGPGGQAAFNVTLFNTGNAPDSFSVELRPLPANWSTGVANLSLADVLPGANGTLALVVTVPKNAIAGVYDMTVVVRSAGDPNLTKEIPVQITVVAKAPPAAAAISQSSWPIVILIIVLLAAVGAGVGAYAVMRRKKEPPEQAAREQEPPARYADEDAAAAGPPAPPQAAPRYLPQAASGNMPQAPPPTYESVAVAEAVPVPVSGGEDLPVAEAMPYTGEGIAAGQLPPDTACLWCFKPFQEGVSWRTCASCGAAFHESCALAAGSCPRCGGPL